ncbi:MAG: hypothetical protein LBK95_11590 [Bifidobacteriaceae bacterium]|jgi:hypothetical protein|nr:hypothetical protein [Bifidobacteriaceae bacterium]
MADWEGDGSVAISLPGMSATSGPTTLRAELTDPATGRPLRGGSVTWIKTGGSCHGSGTAAWSDNTAFPAVADGSGTAWLTVVSEAAEPTTCRLTVQAAGAHIGASADKTESGTAGGSISRDPERAFEQPAQWRPDGSIKVGLDPGWMGGAGILQGVAGGVLGACLVLAVLALAVSGTGWAFARLGGSPRAHRFAKGMGAALAAAVLLAALAGLMVWGASLTPSVSI